MKVLTKTGLIFQHLIQVTCILLLAFSVNAQVKDKSVDEYLEVFNSQTRAAHIRVAKELELSGISDTRLFDLIEKKLLESYSSTAKVDGQYNAWMAKALGFSGQEKYRSTIQKVSSEAGHKSARRHAQKALLNLDKYKQWNPIIADTSKKNTAVSDEVNRCANMLRSNDWELQTIGARRANFAELYLDEYILKIVDEQVKKSYMLDSTDKMFVNSVVHMSKLLAASGNSKYRATVARITEEAPNKKLRKHAKKLLKKY